MEPLQVLIDFVNREADLITTDCASVGIIRSCLVDRLRLVDFLKKNPKVYDEQVDVGGIVVSLPRGAARWHSACFAVHHKPPRRISGK